MTNFEVRIRGYERHGYNEDLMGHLPGIQGTRKRRKRHTSERIIKCSAAWVLLWVSCWKRSSSLHNNGGVKETEGPLENIRHAK